MALNFVSICKFISDSRQSGYGWHLEFSFKLIHLSSSLTQEWTLKATAYACLSENHQWCPFEAEADLLMTGIPSYLSLWKVCGSVDTCSEQLTESEKKLKIAFWVFDNGLQHFVLNTAR